MLLIRKIFTILKDHYEIGGSDFRTKDLPLVSNHGAIFLIMLGYVYLVRQLGPSFMAKRKPYNIKTIMQCYNVVQILLNMYIFVGITNNYIFHPQYNWSCMNLDKSDVSHETMQLRKYVYTYFLSKFLDLLDTVFFVLRKKNNQISYLHIYHHTIMLYAGFIYLNIIYATQFTVVGWINSLVHVLMYIYYFLAALDTNINLEAWKPRMTQIQIIQFFYIALIVFIPLVNNWCGLPYFWLGLLFVQTLYMTTLFAHFYWKTYIVKRRNARKKQQLLEKHD